MILANYYVLVVPDDRVAGDFFVVAMGFSLERMGYGWRYVKRDNCLIMLESSPKAIPPSRLGPHAYFGYLVVEDVEEEYRRVVASGLAAVDPPEDKPWGMRQFSVTTPDGHRFMVGQERVLIDDR